MRELHSIVRSAAAAAGLPLPLLIATDSYAYSAPFLRQLLPRVQDILSAVTWHDYPLHAGVQCSGPAAENNSEVDEIIMSSGGMDQFFLMVCLRCFEPHWWPCWRDG